MCPLTLLPPENLLLWQGTAAFSCCRHALLREEFHPEQGHDLPLGKVFQDDVFLRKITHFNQIELSDKNMFSQKFPTDLLR